MRRREALKAIPVGLGSAVALFRSLADPFSLSHASAPAATYRGPSEEWEGFLLLAWGDVPPNTIMPIPPGRLPSTEGAGATAFDERLRAPEAARKYSVDIPTLDLGLTESLTQVRSNEHRQVAWAVTQYYSEGSPAEAASIAIRPVYPKPFPLEPFGSPASAIIPWEKAQFLPAPGVILTVGPNETAMWIAGGVLHILRVNRAAATEWSMVQAAGRVRVVKPTSGIYGRER